MKIWKTFEKIGNRWIMVEDTFPKGRKTNKTTLRRITNRKAKKLKLTNTALFSLHR